MSPSPTRQTRSVQVAQLTYKATIENKGPSLSKDTEFDLALPAGATVVSATVAPSDKGTCAGTGPVICDLGALARTRRPTSPSSRPSRQRSLAATASARRRRDRPGHDEQHSDDVDT